MRRAAIVFLISVSSQALAAGDPKECIPIKQDLVRLACYDRIVMATDSAEGAPLASAGKWAVETKKSEFKDTNDVFLTVRMEDVLECGMFDRSPATLLLRCMENSTAVMLATSCHMASGFSGYGRVEYRVDDKPSRTKNFEASTDNSALGLWNGGSAIPFIKELFGGKRLLMRFTPFNESPVTAEFDISGLEEAIASLRKECSW
ncbi:MAG: type VI secretion system-associated protein TagO [Paracoccaceae bacterium]